MVEAKLLGGYFAVPYPAVTLNGMYLPDLNRESNVEEVVQWAVVGPPEFILQSGGRRVFMDAEGKRPYPYTTLQDCNNDVRLFIQSNSPPSIPVGRPTPPPRLVSPLRFDKVEGTWLHVRPEDYDWLLKALDLNPDRTLYDYLKLQIDNSKTERHLRYLNECAELADEGELEVDGDAVISISEQDGDEGELGAYVMCWKFLYNSQAKDD